METQSAGQRWTKKWLQKISRHVAQILQYPAQYFQICPQWKYFMFKFRIIFFLLIRFLSEIGSVTNKFAFSLFLKITLNQQKETGKPGSVNVNRIKLFGMNVNLYKVASLVGEIKFSLICNHGAITSEKCIFSQN